MKVLLVYYTGTYNTRYLSNWVQEAFEKEGHTVDRVEIHKGSEVVDTTSYDLIGFSYPIYGFNSPLPFNRYVKKLKFKKGQRYFIYKNSGETLAMNNASSRILLRWMRRRKAVLAGEYHYVMPYNIHFPYDKDFVREILVYDKKLLRIMMHNLSHDIVSKVESRFIYDVGSFFVSIQKIAGDINSFFYKVDNDICTRCGLCVRSCPEQNIRFNKKGNVKFGHHCDMCMRCSFFCPVNAIHIGFLQGWRVNGDYHLAKLEKEGKPEKPYITDESEGFYKCFIKTFKNIDEEYEKLFGKEETEEKAA